jgi:secreted trypsin-like serine protease
MYDNYTLANDIALVKLKKPSSQPIQKLSTNSPKVGTEAKVAGWGVTCFDDIYNCPVQNNLRETTVKIKDYNQCYFAYASNGIYLPPGTICAADVNTDACQGDSGGPLVIGQGTKSVLVGVVSNGIGCADEDFPGVYTDVSKYLNWIGSHIGTIQAQGKMVIKRRGAFLKITNTSSLKTKLTRFKINGSKKFNVKNSTCRSSINPGQSCKIRVIKKKKMKKRSKARLAIYNKGGVVKSVKLIG